MSIPFSRCSRFPVQMYLSSTGRYFFMLLKLTSTESFPNVVKVFSIAILQLLNCMHGILYTEYHSHLQNHYFYIKYVMFIKIKQCGNLSYKILMWQMLSQDSFQIHVQRSNSWRVRVVDLMHYSDSCHNVTRGLNCYISNDHGKSEMENLNGSCCWCFAYTINYIIQWKTLEFQSGVFFLACYHQNLLLAFHYSWQLSTLFPI